MMTFDEFRETKTFRPNFYIANEDRTTDANVYHGGLYIETYEGGPWSLTLYNDSWATGDLDLLERKLYEFAVREGYFDPAYTGD